MIDPDALLMIEPRRAAAAEPVVDALTRRMTAAWRARRAGAFACAGVHFCVCGAASDNLPAFVRVCGVELETNSLCVHYLAFHRAEVPERELEKVRALEVAEGLEPTDAELARPRH